MTTNINPTTPGVRAARQTCEGHAVKLIGGKPLGPSRRMRRGGVAHPCDVALAADGAQLMCVTLLLEDGDDGEANLCPTCLATYEQHVAEQACTECIRRRVNGMPGDQRRRHPQGAGGLAGYCVPCMSNIFDATATATISAGDLVTSLRSEVEALKIRNGELESGGQPAHLRMIPGPKGADGVAPATDRFGYTLGGNALTYKRGVRRNVPVPEMIQELHVARSKYDRAVELVTPNPVSGALQSYVYQCHVRGLYDTEYVEVYVPSLHAKALADVQTMLGEKGDIDEGDAPAATATYHDGFLIGVNPRPNIPEETGKLPGTRRGVCDGYYAPPATGDVIEAYSSYFIWR